MSIIDCLYPASQPPLPAAARLISPLNISREAEGKAPLSSVNINQYLRNRRAAIKAGVWKIKPHKK